MVLRHLHADGALALAQEDLEKLAAFGQGRVLSPSPGAVLAEAGRSLSIVAGLVVVLIVLRAVGALPARFGVGARVPELTRCAPRASGRGAAPSLPGRRTRSPPPRAATQQCCGHGGARPGRGPAV